MSALGDKMRRHREVFELAMRENCTLVEADARLRARAIRAREQRRETERRCGTEIVTETGPQQLAMPLRAADRFDAPWMMRD